MLIHKNMQKTLDTLKIIKDRDLTYQKQVVNTMYNRAKYHPHQTETMREAMKVFEKWLQKNNINYYSSVFMGVTSLFFSLYDFSFLHFSLYSSINLFIFFLLFFLNSL